jgi:hypothetical protein
MGNATNLQCKALKGRGKRRGRKSNEKQWQEQWQEQWETMKSADVMQPKDEGRGPGPGSSQQQKPADEQRRAATRTNRRLGFQPSPN